MHTNEELKAKNVRAQKMLVWLGVGSIAMFFGAFTSAYMVLQADHFWVLHDLPTMFGVSTIVIAFSSLSMWMATRCIKQGNTAGLKRWLSVTLLLGLAFTATQYKGWEELNEGGKFVVGHINDLTGQYGKDYLILMKGQPMLFHDGHYFRPDDIGYEKPMDDRINGTFNVSSSFLFILSGLHIAHLAGGLIYLIVLLFNAKRGRYSATAHLGVDLGAIYWHFLDILWIYLFLFLTFIR
ncbi:MAG: cytochrome c oxidase subunit 3 [Flavobacteriales bacterium]|nr:cytochrome c oxidase subunit 3 [Flavobacteriales bacterium]